MRSEVVVTWALRALWALQAVAAGPAYADALADRSRPIQLVASIGLWAAWGVGLVATLVPTTVSLTIVRLLAPGALATAGWAWLAGASTLRGAAAVATTAAVALVVSSAEIGRSFVQGSAYGDEHRYPLRPPVPLVRGPLPVLWAVAAAGLVAGPLLLAGRAWIAGAVLVVLGVPVAVVIALRMHQLSRRWVVLVPAGVVVHDPVGLADTALFPRATVARVRLAPADTGAADLSAGALGLAVELTLTEPTTVVLAADRAHRQGRALHASAVLFRPSRPGLVLAECGLRRLPVGHG